MSTGTLDLAEVDEERRRLERRARADAGGNGDRGDDSSLTPEEHARRIVASVLAAAQDGAARDARPVEPPLDPEDPVAIARRIVEEVLATEAVTDTVQHRVTTEERSADEAVSALDIDDAMAAAERPRVDAAAPERRDLVMLGTDEPIALVPGPVYEAGTGPFVPPRDEIGVLVERAMATLRTETDTLTGTLREAAESPGLSTTRWVLLGLLWMAAFAGLVPFAAATMGNALDIDVEIFGEETTETTVVEQQPEDASTDNPSVEGGADEGATTP